MKVKAYNIEKKIKFNNIEHKKYLIEDYKIYYTKLGAKYKEFDKLGVNKSRSILNNLRDKYRKICENKHLNSDDIFEEIIRSTKTKVLESSNYTPIPDEELEECLKILIVHAFIECKIFEDPEDYKNVIT